MTVHGEVPETKEKITTEQLMEKVMHFASTIMGEDNAVRAADIMENRFGLRHKGTDASLRKAMKILLRENHIPIVSNTSGFFVAGDRAELLKYRENIVSRIVGLKRTLDGIDVILRQSDIHEYLEKTTQPKEAVQQTLQYREA